MSNQIKFKAHFDFVLKALVLLQNPVSMKELKKGLSLTDRSVYRWIQHLEELGFEVEKTISSNPRKFQIKGGSAELFQKTIQLMELCYPKTP